MRRVGVAAVVPTFADQARGVISIKGRVENRINKYAFEKDKAVVVAKLRNIYAKRKHPAPLTRKEEMEHMTYGPEYERVPDLQRAANDLMAMYSMPHELVTETAYHYHKTWKILTVSKTGQHDTNPMGIGKITPQ